MSMSSTDRRSFLKVGALAATPVAMLAPVTALADDGTRTRLAQLEDEKAIADLTRAFLRRFNTSDAASCDEFIASADAICVDTDLIAIAEDQLSDPVIELVENGARATYHSACMIERSTDFTGNSTLEQMARFQGYGSALHSHKGVLDAQFARTAEGWTITRLSAA